MLKQELRYVSDDLIEDEPAFRLSWGAHGKRLASSIARIGLVSPLVLWPYGGQLWLLCGARRRQALKELGATSYPAFCLNENLEPREALSFALEENLGHRDFNEAEKVLALSALYRQWGCQEIIDQFMSALGLPPKREVLDAYLEMAELGPEGLDALAEDRLDPESGRVLTEMDRADRRAAMDLLNRLRPGKNKRLQILTFLAEIARREDQPVREIIDSPEIREILSASEPNRPLQEKMVREFLKGRRYPDLSDLQTRQADHLKALKLPENVRLVPPLNFEGLDFAMEITFSDVEELKNLAPLIERLTDEDDLKSLLEMG